MDIIVTSPKHLMAEAAQEAEECKEWGGGEYYRNIKRMPKNLSPGDKIWYVEDGYIRGFATVCDVIPPKINLHELFPGYNKSDFKDNANETGYVVSRAESWQWIKPIKMKGFQGWRYFKPEDHEIKIVGNWLADRPEVMPERTEKQKMAAEAGKTHFVGDDCPGGHWDQAEICGVDPNVSKEVQ